MMARVEVISLADYATTNKPSTPDQLAASCLRLARGMAAEAARRHPCADRDALESAAFYGLARAVRAYDPAKGNARFSSFAGSTIRWEIIEDLRKGRCTIGAIGQSPPDDGDHEHGLAASREPESREPAPDASAISAEEDGHHEGQQRYDREHDAAGGQTPPFLPASLCPVLASPSARLAAADVVVAAMLAGGWSLEAIARDLGHSIFSVRSRVARVREAIDRARGAAAAAAAAAADTGGDH